MTLRGAYAWAFGLAVELGLLAVLLGGTLPPWVWPAAAAPVFSAWLRARDRALPGLVGTGIALLAFAAGGLVVAREGLEALLVGGGVALVGLLVGRLLTRQTLEHDLQVLALSLLAVFAGSVLHTQLSYGVVFVLYAIAASWALVTRQLVRGATARGARAAAGALARRDVVTSRFTAAIAGLALIILATTSMVFLLFPRFGFASLGLFARERFPFGVSLSQSPRAAGGGAIMARVWGLSFADFERGLYLRGPVYDLLTRDGFARGEVPATSPHLARASGADLPRIRYEVFLQPGWGQNLLTLGPVVRAHTVSGGNSIPSFRERVLGTGPAGELLLAGTVSGPVRYVVEGAILGPESARGSGGPYAPEVISGGGLDHYLVLGSELDARIPVLAHNVVRAAGAEGGTAAAKADALRAFLLDGFEYTLAQPNSDAPDPLASFLFSDPRGHCEYFATSFATLLRAEGVPSRVVGGYLGGKWDPAPGGSGVVLFAGANAHAWVEWFDPQRGWVPDDATPPSGEPLEILAGAELWLERLRRLWDDSVVDYSVYDQFRILSRVAGAVDSPLSAMAERVGRRGALWALGLVLGALAVAFALRRRRRGSRLSHSLAEALVVLVERRTGERVSAASTVREAVERMCGNVGHDDGVVGPARAALAAYETDRFSGRPVDREQLRRLAGELRRLGS